MSLHQPGALEHPVDAGGADGDDVGVEHHEGQPPVAFQRVLRVEAEDRPLLPALQPPVAGDLAVVLVGLAVALPPRVELALGDPQPGDEPLGRDLGPLGPAADVVNDGVAGVVGDPGSVQSPPSPFFSRTCSSISSETTSSLRRILSRRASMVRWCSPSAGLPLGPEAAAPLSKSWRRPAEKNEGWSWCWGPRTGTGTLS